MYTYIYALAPNRTRVLDPSRSLRDRCSLARWLAGPQLLQPPIDHSRLNVARSGSTLPGRSLSPHISRRIIVWRTFYKTGVIARVKRKTSVERPEFEKLGPLLFSTKVCRTHVVRIQQRRRWYGSRVFLPIPSHVYSTSRTTYKDELLKWNDCHNVCGCYSSHWPPIQRRIQLTFRISVQFRQPLFPRKQFFPAKRFFS